MNEKKMLIDLLNYFEEDEFIVTHVIARKKIKNKNIMVIVVLTSKKMFIYGKSLNESYFKAYNYKDVVNNNNFVDGDMVNIAIKTNSEIDGFICFNDQNTSSLLSQLEELVNYEKTYGLLEFDYVQNNNEYVNKLKPQLELLKNQSQSNTNKIISGQNKYPYNSSSNGLDITSLKVGVGILIACGILIMVACSSKAPSTTNTTTKDNEIVISQTKNDWETYAESYVEIKNIECNYMNSFLQGSVPGIKLEIKNNGDKSIKKLDLKVYFQDASGNDIYEDKLYIINDGGFLDDFGALKPNYSWKNDTNTFRTFENVPTDWKEGAIRITVDKLEFN